MYSSSGLFRRRPLFWLAVCFCAGIVLDANLRPSLFTLVLFNVACVVAGVVAVIGFRRAAFTAGIAAAVSVGALMHASRARIGAADDIRRITPERTCLAWVRGTILEADWRWAAASPDETGPTHAHWTLDIHGLGPAPDALRPASGKMRVSVRLPAHAAESFAEGDVVEFQGRAEPLPVSTLPDNFDYGAYLAGLGVGREGFAEPGTLRKIAGPAWWRIALRLRRFSGELASRSQALLQGNAERAGLLNAIVFGRRESLSPTDREAFAVSGTAYLLAISGLHLYFVCWLGWRVMHALGFSRRNAAYLVLAASLAYCLLTGSPPPAARSTVMLFGYVLASLVCREHDSLNALAVAALVILCRNPQELFTAGFQLSFVAVWSMSTMLPAFEERIERWRERRARKLLTEESPVPPSIWKQQLGWAGQWALRATLATLCAWLATAPAVAWHMGRFSTLSLLVNLFALPLLFVSMIAGFATLTASFISAPLAAMLGWVTSEIFGLLELLTRACAGIPGSSVDLPRPALATILIYAALMLWIWFAHSRRGEVRGLWLIAAACPLILLSNVLFQANVTAPELTIFDLGRGRAALLETPNGSALIDAGGRGQGLRLAETLRRRGTRKLALLVLTSDEPEALDGALDLAAHVPIARVILPRCKAASAARRELEALLTGKGIDYGTPAPMEKIAVMPNVTWEFCDDGPAIGQPAANHSVLCVRVRSSTFTALLADARSSASLKRLLAKRADGWSADILRLIPGDAGTWPQETNELIARAGSKVIVAGTFADAEELPGVDFDKLDARIFSPRGDGTVRIRKVAEQMDVWGYRGEWKKLE